MRGEEIIPIFEVCEVCNKRDDCKICSFCNYTREKTAEVTQLCKNIGPEDDLLGIMIQSILMELNQQINGFLSEIHKTLESGQEESREKFRKIIPNLLNLLAAYSQKVGQRYCSSFQMKQIKHTENFLARMCANLS